MQVGHDDLDPEVLGPGANHRECLGEDVAVHREQAVTPARPADQGHRLRRGSSLVQQRCVRGGQPGEVADHRLEVEQSLEPSLRDLGLVRRVGGVPARVLQHVPADDCRSDGAVVPHPDHRLVGPVHRREGLHLLAPRSPPWPHRAAASARRSGCPPAPRRPSARRGTRSRAPRACAGDRWWRCRCGGGRTSRSRRAAWDACSVTRGSSTKAASPSVALCFRVAWLRTVLVPERFRGGFAPSALRERRLSRLL